MNIKWLQDFAPAFWVLKNTIFFSIHIVHFKLYYKVGKIHRFQDCATWVRNCWVFPIWNSLSHCFIGMVVAVLRKIVGVFTVNSLWKNVIHNLRIYRIGSNCRALLRFEASQQFETTRYNRKSSHQFSI